MATTVTDATGGSTKLERAAGVTIKAAAAWAVLFLVFTAMTDIPPLAEVGAAFAWLLLVAVILKYGVPAFTTITGIYSDTIATPVREMP